MLAVAENRLVARPLRDVSAEEGTNCSGRRRGRRVVSDRCTRIRNGLISNAMYVRVQLSSV